MSGIRSYNLERPLVFFDLETSGLDMQSDSIIEIGAVRLMPDGAVDEMETLVRPPHQISQEITDLTTITNDMLASAKSFYEVAPSVMKFFDGADLAGFNVVRFDGPFLASEFQRVGVYDFLEGRSVVDVQKIYHRYEGRRLENAVQLYCGRSHSDAHRAMADARATLDVLNGMGAQYDWPAGLSVAQLVGHMHDESADMFVDQDRKFFWKDGEACFNFGKYRSKTLFQVANSAPGYLTWLGGQQFNRETMGIIRDAIAGKFPQKSK